MSGADACRCPERAKPVGERAWRVFQRWCNYSAFNGYKRTPSEWSGVCCESCNAHWRTKAKYVWDLKDHTA